MSCSAAIGRNTQPAYIVHVPQNRVTNCNYVSVHYCRVGCTRGLGPMPPSEFAGALTMRIDRGYHAFHPKGGLWRPYALSSRERESSRLRQIVASWATLKFKWTFCRDSWHNSVRILPSRPFATGVTAKKDNMRRPPMKVQSYESGSAPFLVSFEFMQYSSWISTPPRPRFLRQLARRV